MDPKDRAPEEYGHDRDGSGAQYGEPTARYGEPGAAESAAGEGRHPVQEPPAATAPSDPDGGRTPGPARTVQLVSGDYLLTVNPVDGSEVGPCPPTERPGTLERNGPEERAELRRAALPPVPPGQAAPGQPPLERTHERERLARLLARGRSVRVTGPAGSGRSVLLDAVATDCVALAPDGIVRLSGYRRTPTELLHALFATVHDAARYRPDRARLLEAVRGIGAVVVLDDIEFGGSELDELLDATPECVFLISATPDVPAPFGKARFEEVVLAGLSRAAGLQLLERAVHRPLANDETAWAADLWFESEGLPLRFVQAGALLRQRDALRPRPDVSAEDPDAPGEALESFAAFDPAARHPEPLPNLAESAAAAGRLAAGLSEVARDVLRFAVALGGECPLHPQLPALTGNTHADGALTELLGCGLLTQAGAHYRLANGVASQLEAIGYAEDAAGRAHTVARHYTWWAGHRSVAAERVAAEADVIIAAMSVLLADRESVPAGAVVLLARTAAPALAAALHWSAWERVLRNGQEAARLSGEVAEEAYFHHELGVLAICSGNPGRARAELEASIGLRGVLADRRGAVAGRRALALVEDQVKGFDHTAVATPTPPGGIPAAAPAAAPRQEGGRSAGLSAAQAVTASEILASFSASSATEKISEVTTGQLPVPEGSHDVEGPHDVGVVGGRHQKPRGSARRGSRRNKVALGAGTLLAAVLGTVVTMGAISEEGSGGRVRTEQPEADDGEGDDLAGDDTQPGTGDRPKPDASRRSGGSARQADPGGDDSRGSGGTTGGDPRTSDPAGPAQPDDPSGRPTKPSDRPTKPTPSSSEPTESQSPTESPEPSSSPSESDSDPIGGIGGLPANSSSPS